jgi:hypothetical protein
MGWVQRRDAAAGLRPVRGLEDMWTARMDATFRPPAADQRAHPKTTPNAAKRERRTAITTMTRADDDRFDRAFDRADWPGAAVSRARKGRGYRRQTAFDDT